MSKPGPAFIAVSSGDVWRRKFPLQRHHHIRHPELAGVDPCGRWISDSQAWTEGEASVSKWKHCLWTTRRLLWLWYSARLHSVGKVGAAPSAADSLGFVSASRQTTVFPSRCWKLFAKTFVELRRITTLIRVAELKNANQIPYFPRAKCYSNHFRGYIV